MKFQSFMFMRDHKEKILRYKNNYLWPWTKQLVISLWYLNGHKAYYNNEGTTIKELKNAPSVLLSYMSTRELLRTREKCEEARAEVSSKIPACLYNNARGTSFFLLFLL